MKKITILFFLFSFASFAQDVDYKLQEKKTETISFDQYDLIKKVNDLHPDILVSKIVINNYSNNLKVRQLIDTNLVYDLPSDCNSYSVVIRPDNTRLDYFYEFKDKSLIYGNVTVFNGSVYRTYFNIKDKIRLFRLYIDGKIVNEYKN